MRLHLIYCGRARGQVLRRRLQVPRVRRAQVEVHDRRGAERLSKARPRVHGFFDFFYRSYPYHTTHYHHLRFCGVSARARALQLKAPYRSDAAPELKACFSQKSLGSAIDSASRGPMRLRATLNIHSLRRRNVPLPGRGHRAARAWRLLL